MKKRTLIILVAILVLLYLVGTTLTLTRGDGNENDAKNPPGWIEGLGSMLERDLSVSDIQSATPNSCRSQFRNRVIRLNASHSCQYFFKDQSRFRRARSIELRPVSGAVTVAINSGSIVESENLKRNGMKLSIDKDGGLLSLSCAAGGSCEVRLR